MTHHHIDAPRPDPRRAQSVRTPPDVSSPISRCARACGLADVPVRLSLRSSLRTRPRARRHHRQRLQRPGGGHSPEARGDARLRRPREGQRRGRHLARQHLSRVRLRRAVAPLLVLVRPEPRSGAARSRRSPRSSRTCGTARAATGSSRTSASSTPSRAAPWDDDGQRWRIVTSKGARHGRRPGRRRRARSASRRSRSLPGLETFEGPAFHSARWDHGVDLKGKSVAVVGTGASAIQFVPEIQPSVAKLSVFQRTPPWILPRNNPELSEGQRRTFRALPALQQLARAQIYAVTELFGLGFRHPALMRPLQRAAVDVPRSVRSRPRAPRQADAELRARVQASPLLEQVPARARRGQRGRRHREPSRRCGPASSSPKTGRSMPVDAIIFGTGFHVSDLPFGKYVPGRGGRSLEDVWKGSPQAHLGTTVSGLPELLLPPRTEHGARAHVGRLHDREPDRAPRERASLHARPSPRDRGAAGRGAGGLRRGPGSAHGQARYGARADARAGTSTRPAETPRCGRTPPGGFEGACRASSPPSTCSASRGGAGRTPSPAPVVAWPAARLRASSGTRSRPVSRRPDRRGRDGRTRGTRPWSRPGRSRPGRRSVGISGGEADPFEVERRVTVDEEARRPLRRLRREDARGSATVRRARTARAPTRS